MPSQKDLERLLVDKNITRRQFIERMAAIGAVAAIPGALETAQAATPKRGGRLRVGSSTASTADSYDPVTCCTEYTGLYSHLLRNKLVALTPNLVPVGDLAIEWEVSPDASRWTFKLHKAEFHSGAVLKPEDVVYSVNYHRGEDSPSPAKPLMDQIKDVKKKGSDAVEFILEAGNADFVALLNDPHMHIIPDGADWLAGDGTGAYKHESFEPGVRWIGKRNDNYFREGLPYFDEIELIAISDPATRVSALRTGEVDVIDHPDPKVTRLLEQDPNIKIERLSGLRHFSMPMRFDTPPYDNNDVRMALKLAMDREEIVDKTLRGLGEPGNDHPISKVNRYHAGDAIPQRVYDPDKAKWHLKKSGAENFTFTLSTSEGAFGEAVDFAILYKEQAAVAGINIDIQRMPADGYWDSVWRHHDWCFSYWSGRPTEDWMFSMTYSEGANWNESKWSHARFNKLLKEGRVELNDDKRREIYVEMQLIVRDEGSALIPAFNDQLMAANKKVMYNKPLRVDRMWDGYGGPQRWWFA